MLKTFEIPLGSAKQELPRLRGYILDPADNFCDLNDFTINRPRPAVVVMPGGGYDHFSPREAEPIAIEYAAKGFQTFILYYSLLPVNFPKPLIDAALALKTIRERAREWNVDVNRIAVLGFSAGGHLAGALSTFWNGEFLKQQGFDPEMIRPNAAVLCYAATGTGENEPNREFAKRMLGDNINNPALAALTEIHKNVSPDNPPTFLWQTSNDPVVALDNSLMMAHALNKAGVQLEMHIFPDGPHGIGAANELTASHIPDGRGIHKDAAKWVALSIDWLKGVLKFKN